MARKYAGMLGLLAFATVAFKSAVESASPVGSLPAAAVAMFVFAALGWVVGSIAEATVVEGVRVRFLARLTAGASEKEQPAR